jgi:hypothetical protein
MNPEDIRQLVQARIGQAVESLADAQTLLEAGRGGRSIVNRSYYSMFYGVLALLQTINRIRANTRAPSVSLSGICPQGSLDQGAFRRSASRL